MSGPQPLRFVGAHGIDLAADSWGAPAAQPVVLLHGGGQTRHAWGGTAGALARLGYHAIAVDARGHGESAWDGACRYDLQSFVEDLAQLVPTLTRPPVLVGASLGGSTALLAVGELGVAAEALVLVDIAPQIEPAGVRRILAFMSAHPEGFVDLPEAADAVAAYLPHRKRPKDLGGLRKNLRLRDDGRLHWHWDPAFLNIVRERDPVEHLRRKERAAQRLRVPTLLVRGGLSDLVTEEGARQFLALVPHARYVDVSGAAHMVAGDRNDRFTAAVVEFLTEVTPPT
ncbi:MAG: alpha/beta hydrolase [Deltaproteobacteria bacterium]|nr:alpha/beta hydrolase [Deltaproteobacteria bacterium]